MFPVLKFIGLLLLAMSVSACLPAKPVPQAEPTHEPTPAEVTEPSPTPLPTRAPFNPGELVEYTVQTGDTLPALALRFNTTRQEILQANPGIPADVTTLPPGMPMKIPIYYEPLWGSAYQILPDSHFINGPLQQDFDVASFINSQPGWLKYYSRYVDGRVRNGAEIIVYVATNYSISPRLLLAILEYQLQALSDPNPPANIDEYALGIRDPYRQSLYGQLIWAANALNNGYYGWRAGTLQEITFLDGRLERPDPWQNAATVALRYYFSRFLGKNAFEEATYSSGLIRTYTNLFGDPWLNDQPHIPGSLQQPAFSLPFQAGKTWSYTGGPHSAWGDGEPLAAVDFAPGNIATGCVPSQEWVVAIAPGTIVRVEEGIAVLDTDDDHDERTGWVIFYLHLATQDKVALGARVQAGDPIGHPSCEGGRSTGTHIHIARKFNGEWMQAALPPVFDMEGWQAQNGDQPYRGFLVRFSKTVRASETGASDSQITAGK